MEGAQPKRRSSSLPTITKELVFEACEGLKAQKRPVTNSNVREALSGGSLLTINPWVREWQTIQEERFRLSLTAIPDQVQATVTLMAQEMWRTTSDLASQQLIELGKRMQEGEAEHLRQIRELEEEGGKLEVERDRLLAEVSQFHEQIEKMRKESTDLGSELSESKTQLTLALLRESDAERYKTMLEKELQTLRESATKAESGKVKFEALLELEKDTTSKLEHELTKTRESEKALSIKITAIEVQLKSERDASKAKESLMETVKGLKKEIIEEMESRKGTSQKPKG